MIESERGSVDYHACGDGPTIVLVPGSCSTGAAWRSVISQFGDEFRCITTSLLGYGGTAERRSIQDPDISHEAEALEVVIQRAACPVHLVGHSFGGLVSLAVALRRRVPLLSLVIIEAPAPGVLRCMGEDQHYLAFRNMTDTYFDACQAGEPTAIEAVIDFYGGAGTFAAWPQRVRDYAVQTTAINMLDWASAYGFQPNPAALATVRVPSLILRGEHSHPAVQRANELLAQCLPEASLATLSGASHFMIATHAEYVASLIARRVRRVECVESIRMRAGQFTPLSHEVHPR